MRELQARLKAIGEPEPVLRSLQLAVVAAAQKEAAPFRKTGNLQRQIVPGRISGSEAQVEANAPYSLFVEKGTGLYGPKHQKITPKHGKVLAWDGGGPAKVRLTGRSRTSGGKALASKSFATSVKGRKATPFLEPGAKKAAAKSGIADVIVEIWNEAG